MGIIKDRIFVRFKRAMAKAQTRWYMSRFGKVGNHVVIQNDCVFTDPASVFIGHDVFINFHTICMSVSEAPIYFGNHVIIGPNCVFATANHAVDYLHTPIINSKRFNNASIVIEDDVWIGANVTIVPGIRIHTGAVVGAGSVVTKDVPSKTIVAGVPARTIRRRRELTSNR